MTLTAEGTPGAEAALRQGAAREACELWRTSGIEVR